MSTPHGPTANTASALVGARGDDLIAARLLHAGFVIAVLAFGVLFADSYRVLIQTWARSGMFQFQFLIPPIAALMIWDRRRRLSGLAAAPRWLGLVGVFALGFVWLVGALADVNLVTDAAVIVAIPALVYAFYGPAITRALAFPLAYLLFAIPVGAFLVGPLQQITAHMSVRLLDWTGVPVLIAGNFLTTPAGIWHVAEACSGIKFFFATAAFGVLYANLFYQRLRRRLIFVACALVVPIIANGLRVYFTILIGETFGVEYASGTDHMIFGWQFFGTVLVLLFLAGWPWHESPPAGPARDTPPPRRTRLGSRWAVAPFVAAALAAIAAAPAWLALSRTAAAAPAASPTLPARLAGLQRLETGYGPGLGLRFAQPDRRARAAYGDPQPRLRVDYAAYADAGARELLTSGNQLFERERWRIERQRTLRPDGGPALVALDLAAKRGSGGWRLRYAYRIGARWSTSPLAIKAWRVAYGLALQPAPIAAVVVAARADPSGVSAARLTQAAEAVVRALGAPDADRAS